MRIRTKWLHIRLTPEEYREVKMAVQSREMSISQFVRNGLWLYARYDFRAPKKDITRRREEIKDLKIN